MDEKIIYQYLESLVDQPICSLGRKENKFWLGIGQEKSVIDRNGCMVKKGTYELHIQSAFRVVNKEKCEIIFASSDFYSPNSVTREEKDFEWNINGNNLFDEKSRSWLEYGDVIYVKEYKINRWGDLLLVLSNGDYLEIVVDTSDYTECWRLLKCGSDEEHMVVTGDGVFFIK